MCDAQSLILSPVIEFKNALHLNSNREIEGPGFTYVPAKINFKGIAPLNVGLNVEYRFKNANSVTLGIMQDHPQMAYEIHFISYDSVPNIYSPNSVGVAAAANSLKLPLTFVYKLSEKVKPNSRTVIERKIHIGAALYYHKSSQIISQNNFGYRDMDSIRYIGVSSRQIAYNVKSLILSLAYSWDFLVKDRHFFNLTVFVDYCPFKVIFQSASVLVYDGTQGHRYYFRNDYSASGFGFRISKPIRVWKPKVYEPYKSKLSNEH